MKKEGTIKRQGNEVVVQVPHEPYAADLPGVTCVNPDAPEEKRIYEKIFRRKKIFLPHEYDRAVADIMQPDTFVLSMNGYSRITAEQCRRYGIKRGSYEQACAAILRRTIEYLRSQFKAQLRLTFGASDLGVDAAIESVAREFNITPLGFSCPRYMMYVKDDDIPVYVGANGEEYSDAFIRSLDLLITTGGREVALQHDVSCACIHNKRIHFVDVLNSLSNTGGVPATVVDEQGRVRVDNAAAAFGSNISFFSRSQATQAAPPDGDHWDAIFANCSSVATDVCRRKMSPERMFS